MRVNSVNSIRYGPTTGPPHHINLGGGPTPASTEMLSFVSQHGITWTFDQEYPVGEFVNGDYFVVGPVDVIEISRPAVEAYGTARDGSMIDPVPSQEQGYDDRFAQYVSSFNVANYLPITISSGSSLISSISRNPENTIDRVRPLLELAAVLSVVEEIPAQDAFRPPYAGTDKPIYRSNNLHTDLLLNLSAVATTPTVEATADKFQKPWVDHVMEWQGDDFHPRQNMPNYGGGISRDLTEGVLRLLISDTIEDKMPLLINLIQIGIDFYGLADNGAVWGTVGGSIGVGRKLPILLAGMMLDDHNMKNVSYSNDTRIVFQEDHQTFYLTQEARDQTYHSDNCLTAAYCYPGYYDEIPLGSAVWGERAYLWETTNYNYLPGKLGYRSSTHRSTRGSALFIRLMSAESLWNYDAFLDWVDYEYSDIEPGGWGSEFVDEMWQEFR